MKLSIEKQWNWLTVSYDGLIKSDIRPNHRLFSSICCHIRFNAAFIDARNFDYQNSPHFPPAHTHFPNLFNGLVSFFRFHFRFLVFLRFSDSGRFTQEVASNNVTWTTFQLSSLRFTFHASQCLSLVKSDTRNVLATKMVNLSTIEYN